MFSCRGDREGFDVPDSDGGVKGGGEEVVRGGGDGEGGDLEGR